MRHLAESGKKEVSEWCEGEEEELEHDLIAADRWNSERGDWWWSFHVGIHFVVGEDYQQIAGLSILEIVVEGSGQFGEVSVDNLSWGEDVHSGATELLLDFRQTRNPGDLLLRQIVDERCLQAGFILRQIPIAGAR